MTKIILASGNKDKIREAREIFDSEKFEIISMKDAGIESDPEENGDTFEANAEIKARDVWDKCGGYVMADDSGLEIDAMPGELGVKSARFMGHDTAYSAKNSAILERLKDVPFEKRTARFVCTIALIDPSGDVFITNGKMEGYISDKIQGENGFGYDPIFYLDEYGCTSAALTEEQKNVISHREKAVRAMRDLLKKMKNRNN